ncbi:unnamed protein product, partial [Closterium sp. NIES-53]
ALVDFTGMERQQINYKRLSLTDITRPYPHPLRPAPHSPCSPRSRFPLPPVPPPSPLPPQALVDFTGMERQQINYKRLSLTDITIDIPKAASKKELRAAIEAGEVQSKWEASSWGRKLLIQKKRAALTDFERFKIAAARSQKAKAVKKALA